MAPTPREVLKPTPKPKVQSSVLRNAMKSVSSVSTNKSGSGENKGDLKNNKDHIELGIKSNKTKQHQLSTLSNVSPQRKMETKENKPVATPGSITKSAKKSRKYMPRPAHSGVPVPEKMRKLLLKASRELI